MVCFLQCFKVIVVLPRYSFSSVSTRGGYDTERVRGPSLGCCLLSCIKCKVNNIYFVGVSFWTFRKHSGGFLSFENNVKQKEEEKIIFFEVWISVSPAYQMSIFVPLSDVIFILENRIFII